MSTYDDIVRQINEGFFEKLSDEGVATIKTDIIDRDQVIRGLSLLDKKFGAIIQHTSTQPFADITLKSQFNDRSVTRPQSDNGPQAPHVDGVLSVEVPTFVVMHCISPAAAGGESVYVDTKDILDFIINSDPAIFAPLFDSNAVVVARPQFGEKHRPVFKLIDTVLEAYFSDHEYNKVRISAKAQTAFNLVSAFVKDTKNQKMRQAHSGDLVFLVNKRLLHGRKAFTDSPEKQRHFIRAWYSGAEANIPPQAKGLGINSHQLSAILPLAREYE